ncbi:MAG TPA: LamG-like jellyroll fold domain-containing protein, partial [Pirellulaceae bacterium]|nr:LamG-like jellyroll fold domain-containing protein [Pirellulaceae bacterium]
MTQHRAPSVSALKSRRNRSRLSQLSRSLRVESLERRDLLAAITGGTGPGGFELANGAGALALWLDSTDINADNAADTLANGQTVSSWLDKSGNGRNASNVLGTPSYIASSATGNYQPMVGFSTAGGSDELYTSYNFDAIGANYSIFGVSRYTGGADGRVITSATRNWLFGHHGASADRWYAEGWVYQGGTNSTAMGLYSASIGPTVPGGSAGDPASDFWKNGVKLATANLGSGNANYWPGQLALGGYSTNAQEASNAEIGSVLIFNRVLNEAERRIVQNNLSSQYNVGIASEDVYAGDTPANGDYDRGVFGIGRFNATNQLLTSGQAGFGIEAAAIADDGDYVMAGYEGTPNAFVNTGIAGTGATQRWSRGWYVDVTDANNNLGATLAFDYSDAGLSIGGANTFRLLTSVDGGTTWTAVPVTGTLSAGDKLSFTLSAAQLSTGLYTLGDTTSPAITTNAAATQYTIGAAAVAVDPTLGLTDGSSPTITGAAVSISGFVNGNADVLAFTPVGAITGVYNSTTGVLTLSGNDTTANYQTALRSVSYSLNTAQGTTSRSLSFTATNLLGLSSQVARLVVLNNTPAANAVVWDGGGDGVTWSQATNWLGDVVPDANDIATFADTDIGAVTVTASTAVGGLNFTNTSSNFTLGALAGVTLTITSGTAAITQTGAGGNIVAVPLYLAGSSIIDVAPSTSLTVSAAISGALGLNKNGTGTLTVHATNTYTGGTNINAGVLRLGAIADVPAGYTGYYSFDNTSGATSGSTVFNGGATAPLYNGVYQTSAVQTSSGFIGNAMSETAAVGSRLEIGGSGIPTGANWTASVWFKGLYGTGDWRTLTRGTGQHQIIIEAGSWRLGTHMGGFFDSGYVIPVALQTDTTNWHQIVAVGSGTTTTFYIDGVQVGVSPNKSTEGFVNIGAGAGNQRFAQNIDEVFVYQTALNAAQVQALYNNNLSLANPVLLDMIPNSSLVTIAATARLDMGGFSETIGNLAGNGTVTNSRIRASTLSVGANNADSSFAGVIQDGAAAVGLNKVGSGVLTL